MKKHQEPITQEEAHRLFSYDKKSGFLYRNVDVGTKVKKGAKVGSIGSSGYQQTSINGKFYYLHRLIWLMEHGYFPEEDIDHKDKDRSNNSFDNLREATRQCNMRHKDNPTNNTSGVKGVYRHHSQKWCAQLKHNTKCIVLGLYEDFDDAVCARLAGEQCLDWSDCDSTSPAYLYVKEKIQNNG